MRNPRFRAAAAVLSGLLLLAFKPFAVAIEWPREVTAEEGRIIVYAPEPERLSGNRLTGRAAMSLELTHRPDPIFGAFWHEATLGTGATRCSCA